MNKVFPLIIGIILIIASIFLFLAMNNEAAKYDETTMGTVTSSSSREESYRHKSGKHWVTRYRTVYDIAVSYTVGDQTYSTSERGSTLAYKVNDRITVYFDSTNPHDCILQSPSNLTLFPILLLAFGVLWTLVGVVFLIKQR